jgi:hypothetical protein
MKPNLFLSSLLLSILFISCKKEEVVTTSETTSTTPKEIIMPRVQAIPSQTYTQQPITQNIAPVQNQTATPNGQVITPNPVATKPGMNPPHGQAGHRCDIAVGAPLNSPKSKQPSPGIATSQPVVTSSTITPAPTTQAATTPAILNPNATETVTAPGMNPPHGQAGHDCAVAVGAPLPKK